MAYACRILPQYQERALSHQSGETIQESLRISATRIRGEVEVLKQTAFERVPEARLPEPVQQPP